LVRVRFATHAPTAQESHKHQEIVRAKPYCCNVAVHVQCAMFRLPISTVVCAVCQNSEMTVHGAPSPAIRRSSELFPRWGGAPLVATPPLVDRRTGSRATWRVPVGRPPAPRADAAQP